MENKAFFVNVLVGILALTAVCYAVPKPGKHVHPLGDEMINFINNVIKPNWTVSLAIYIFR